MTYQELVESLDPFCGKETKMAESVYKVIELVGTSTESWEKAAAAAVATASKSLQDLRIAEVVELDMQLEGGKVALYRAKVKVSFKYHQEE
jgi:flavin-binding protein dodecin